MGCCRKRSPEEGDQPETRRPSGKFMFCFVSVRFLAIWEYEQRVSKISVWELTNSCFKKT